MSVDTRSDGDYHLDVAPDPTYDRFFNKGNKKSGAMVVELMPGQHFSLPAAGEHVALFGTWVHDTHNDWNEFHPVWTIDYLDRGTRTTSLPPVDPLYFKPSKKALIQGAP